MIDIAKDGRHCAEGVHRHSKLSGFFIYNVVSNNIICMHKMARPTNKYHIAINPSPSRFSKYNLISSIKGKNLNITQ